MKSANFRFHLLYVIMFYLIGGWLASAVAAPHPLLRDGIPFCGVDHYQPRWRPDSKGLDNRNYARTTAANLNRGEPRTVRMIYFLPNDRLYQAEVVQQMKDEIRTVQAFFADQMEAHGYGRATFRVETDSQGEPIVHRVDGRHPDGHYREKPSERVFPELAFDFSKNVYLIVVDSAEVGIKSGGEVVGGFGFRSGKQSGDAWVSEGFGWDLVAHELGHAFGLGHDFRDGSYLMSYGDASRNTLRLGGEFGEGESQHKDRLSSCHADFLSVHPHFNPDTPIEEGAPPRIELISPPSYPASAKSIPIRVKVGDPDGLHQVLLRTIDDRPVKGTKNKTSVKACREVGGKQETVIAFDYDGVLPSAHDLSYSRDTSLLNPLIHPIQVLAIDTDGNVGAAHFALFFETVQPLRKIAGDNQHGVPNRPLPVPLSVDLLDLNNGLKPNGVWVAFTVTAGGGTLSVERVQTYRGKAKSTLTLGPNLGTNVVEVSAEGLTVTFNAVAGAPVDIRDATLRTVIEDALDIAPGTPIAPAEMILLTELNKEPPSSRPQPLIYPNINNLTGLEHATNLVSLDLRGEINSSNSVLDLSPLAGLTNLTSLNLYGNTVSDLSPLAGLTNLNSLNFGGSNTVSDLSPLAGLTNLNSLNLGGSTVSDLSPLAGLTGLITLGLWDSNTISDLSPLAGLTNLKSLILPGNNISDLTALSGLTNLVQLFLLDNTISDLSPLSGLINLNLLLLSDNAISDLSPLVENMGLGHGNLLDVRGNPLNEASIKTHIPDLQNRGVRVEFDDVITELVNIPDPNLRAAIETALGKPSGASITTADMARLTHLEAPNANISDLTGLESATNLTELVLGSRYVDPEEPQINSNSVSDLSPLSGLTNLTSLNLGGNTISDISPIAGLTELRHLTLVDNNISDITAVAGLTNLKFLVLHNNAITDISPVAGLTDLVFLFLGGNLLSAQSIETHIPALESRGVIVEFDPAPEEYTLSIPADISLIHVPLKVTAVNGVAKTITTISDLYAALGGASTVNFLITHDSQAQDFRTYFGVSDSGTSADVDLTDDTGVIAGLENPVSVRLTGEALGIDGNSTMTLHQGLNLVGLPLDNSSITRVSDLFTLEGIRGNVPVIILTVGGDFQSVGRAGDPWDIPITGGQGFILTAQRAATVTISGEAWTNASVPAAPPSLSLKGIAGRDTTPILVLRGTVVDERAGARGDGFRVSTKNLSTGKAVAAVTSSDEAGYRLAVVDIEMGRAATIGDTLEISAHSPNPFIGVLPLRYTVTAEDVRQSLIQLPELVAYEIPKETQLLSNYPNPFNPETWIPYRLAEDAFVTLTIYDLNGQVVRTLEVGHRIAAVYESRSKAIYWDGRNEFGETVASGVYFYQLQAGDYSATRKLVILK